MWIKYSGKIVYNSEKLRGVLPGSKVDINELLANKLIKDHPKWFKACSKPIIVKPKDEEQKDEPVEEVKKDEEVKGRRR